MIDWSIHFGNIVEVLILFTGLVIAFARLKDKVDVLHGDLIEIKKEIKKLADGMMKVAVADQRIKTLEQELRDMKKK